MAKTSKDKTIAVKCKLINKNRSCTGLSAATVVAVYVWSILQNLKNAHCSMRGVSRLRTYAVSSSDV